MTINDCKIIELPKFLDARGNLSFVQNFSQIPFEIKRTYWLYDVPGGECRGGHAEKDNEELIVALSGAFEIVVDDGHNSKTFVLNRSYYGLFIPKGLWREIKEFSTNAVALEFGSIPYNVNDYIRDYDAFITYTNNLQSLSTNELKNLYILKDEICQTRKCSVFDCTMIELDKHHSERKGNLTVVENGKTLPFDVKRVYYLYDIPGGESRGAHAHKNLSQLIIAVSGAFRVTLDDGEVKRSFILNRPYQGLYVKPGIWRELDDFSAGAVCMVLASDIYKVEDYIRSYDDFVIYRNGE